MADIRIGTSGWHYGHWLGSFYPRGTPARDMLACYARSFDTVEINNSFYRLPSRKALETWRARTPEGFVFAVKASRFITHMKKLKDPGQSCSRFFAVVAALGDRLGPILFQLPPAWRVDAGRLDDFLAALPTANRYAFEFRDETWFCEPVYRTLRRHGAALCVYHLEGRLSPMRHTAGFDYVRLHGPEGRYGGSYDDATLGRWAQTFRRWRRQGRDVYCYFDNDQKGYAPSDAARLRALLARRR